MRLIAVGRLRAGPEAELFERYNSRLRPKLVVTEVPDGHGAPAEIKRREAEALLAALPADAYAVALDLGAPPVSSEQFAQRLEAWLANGQNLVFVIGGAEGLAKPVLERANHVLSLGMLTWPHMLVRVMLAEQIFRARAMASGHPYHRAGRP
jgi:23S rRNA (pseudouridine1915-N3)-methyltransferase